jgi:hypothetical protein
MPSPLRTPRTPRRTPRRKNPRKKAVHVTIQAALKQLARFKPTRQCTPRLGGSKTKSTRATPASNARNCLGLVRKGQRAPSGKSWNKTAVYIALPHRQRNASYARSGGRSGSGSSHIAAKWNRLYNQATRKAVTLKTIRLPRGVRLL